MIGNLAKLSNVRGVASGTKAASVTVKVDGKSGAAIWDQNQFVGNILPWLVFSRICGSSVESGPVTAANQAKPRLAHTDTDAGVLRSPLGPGQAIRQEQLRR